MGEKAVHKYEIGFAEAVCRMPVEAEFVHVGAIAGKMYVWAIVDPAAPLLPRKIGYFATGEPLPANAEYVGSAIANEGAFVWHVFRENRP